MTCILWKLITSTIYLKLHIIIISPNIITIAITISPNCYQNITKLFSQYHPILYVLRYLILHSHHSYLRVMAFRNAFLTSVNKLKALKKFLNCWISYAFMFLIFILKIKLISEQIWVETSLHSFKRKYWESFLIFSASPFIWHLGSGIYLSK